MKYTILPASEISPDLASRWSEIQQSDFSLGSPYFHPEFTQTVASVRDDVYVAIMESNMRIVGFFPFHHKRFGVARPVGLGLSDYHGVIAEPDAEWTTEGLLTGCKLVRWEYDHLPINQVNFSNYHVKFAESPIIDVSKGIDAFEESRDKSGRKQLRETGRKKQKLEKEIGPITFTIHSSSRDILSQLIAWKSLQCLQSGTVDYFGIKWCRQLIEHIHQTNGDNFGGMLSCLHAGDNLVAVHFAMYSRHIWHSWFPAYDRSFEKYSPGLILLLEMITAAAEDSIQHIDLGKGLSLYKRRMMTSCLPIAEGSAEIPSIANSIHQFFVLAEDMGSKSCFHPLLRIPGKLLNRMKRNNRYE